jgi:molybdopterin/thiamine biosynthesis adenylyltransferase
MGLDMQSLIRFKEDGSDRSYTTGKELVFNPKTKQLEEIYSGELTGCSSDLLKITADDAVMFGEKSKLVIDQRILEDIIERGGLEFEDIQVWFEKIDNGDVYVLRSQYEKGYIKGKISQNESCCPCKEDTKIFLILFPAVQEEQQEVFVINGYQYSFKAYYKIASKVCPLEISLVPVKDKLFSRTDGLYETGKLADAKVAIVGLGSGGSPLAVELVKAGVMYFDLVDDDRLEIVNVVRHVCGISDLGRYKTKAVKEQMLNKNPYARINTYEIKVDFEHQQMVRTIIKKNDLIICATDNRESRLLMNKLCIAENKVCIYGGTFRRACGGQVLRVIPYKTLCYDCFLSLLPAEFTNDYEISNQRQASRISYSDRVVPVEPGLSSDILPISTFMTKLAILELLKDKEHSMKSLYDDFTCPLYLWINRREYQFSNLLPMEAEVDRMSIMRWYGVKVDRYEKCFTCGEMPDLSESEYMIFQ